MPATSGDTACVADSPVCTQVEWGPGMWLFLHRAALAEPEEALPAARARAWLAFFDALAAVLPATSACSCGSHFEEWLQSHPPTLATRTEFFTWTVDTHNFVNERLGKAVVSVPDALALAHAPVTCGKQAQASAPAGPGLISLGLAFLGGVGAHAAVTAVTKPYTK